VLATGQVPDRVTVNTMSALSAVHWLRVLPSQPAPLSLFALTVLVPVICWPLITALCNYYSCSSAHVKQTWNSKGAHSTAWLILSVA